MALAPRSVDDELELAHIVERYGGSMHGGLSTGKLISTTPQRRRS